MFQSACPACGAPVAFRSATSVMAVCAYCQSTLLRDADSVRDVGKMSAVLEDYSPIQITSEGRFEGQHFSVVGRIQLRYDDGFWNEWYLWFDDGSTGWLSDASGQYVVTRATTQAPEHIPQFDRNHPGDRLGFDRATWTCADVREARCTGGEGELPMRVGEGWLARVADYRSGHRFLTLDYSDGDKPTVYAGKSITVDALQKERLRRPEQIAEKAGRLPGSLNAVACPSCGAQLNYLAAAAQHMVCPQCQAEVAVEGDKAAVLATHRSVEAVETTLELGAVGSINGTKWQLIGLMRCREDASDGESWTEYLLHHAHKGFKWLVETTDEWHIVSVLDNWPDAATSQVRVDGRVYTKMYDYRRTVTFAAGAFNWRVKVGDRANVSEYKSSNQNVTAERTANELSWSYGSQVSSQTVAQWFKDPSIAAGFVDGTASTLAATHRARVKAEGGWTSRGFAWIFTVLLLVLNVPLLIAGYGEMGVTFLGLLALWAPVETSLWESD
ncbi:DUF4178 domain-containing protein [Uliginosibacterium sp. H1]|uniref:DUF4178 domain-containing protein n=1 Tax=Uliginosibacterium sp. H1 TaxID=3114757 RepID=UPI002E1777DE|nr:DUF4178 domain-containing protein [Uliginosibacterium sp. H1]